MSTMKTVILATVMTTTEAASASPTPGRLDGKRVAILVSKGFAQPGVSKWAGVPFWLTLVSAHTRRCSARCNSRNIPARVGE